MRITLLLAALPLSLLSQRIAPAAPQGAKAKTGAPRQVAPVSVRPSVKPLPVLLRQGDGKGIVSLALSPDGKTLLAATAEQRFALDLATGKEAGDIKAILGQAGSISPDGAEVLSPRTDFWLQIFNARTGALRAEVVPLAVGFPYQTAWSPDGKKIAVASANQVDLLDAVSTKKIAGTIAPIGTSARCVAFSPDGSRLAAGFGSKSIEIYSTSEFDAPGFTANTFLNGPRLKAALSLSGHAGAVNVVRWSRDGRSVFAGDGAGSVSFWDAGTGQRSGEVPMAASGISDLALAPSGQSVAVAAPDLLSQSSVILCDIATRKPKLVWNGRNGDAKVVASRVLFAPEGKSLLVGDASGTVWRVPIASLDWFKAPAQAARIDVGDSWALSGVVKGAQVLAFEPGGQFLIAADFGGQLGRWNVVTGEKARLASGHTQSITTLALSSDGKLLGSGGWSGLEVLELSSGKVLWRLDGQWSGAAGFSRDGSTLYASIAGDIKALDARSGQGKKIIGNFGKVAQKIALSPDGQRIAVAFVTGSNGRSALETLQVWSVASGRKEWEKPFGGYIKSLAWSGDSGLLALDNGDRDEGYPDGYTFKPGKMGVWVLEGATGQESTLSNLSLKAPVESLAFAPSGRALFVSSQRLRDETTLLSLPGHPPVALDAARQALLPTAASAVAISPDSKLLAFAPSEGPIQVVRLP